MLDYFISYLLPLALMIGMTPEQFWEDDPNLFYAYWDAYEMKEKRENALRNINNFNLGQYFMLAVAQNLQFTKNPKQIYPKKPFDLDNNKKVNLTQEEYEEIRKIQLKAMVDKFNQK